VDVDDIIGSGQRPRSNCTEGSEKEADQLRNVDRSVFPKFPLARQTRHADAIKDELAGVIILRRDGEHIHLIASQGQGLGKAAHAVVGLIMGIGDHAHPFWPASGRPGLRLGGAPRHLSRERLPENTGVLLADMFKSRQ